MRLWFNAWLVCECSAHVALVMLFYLDRPLRALFYDEKDTHDACISMQLKMLNQVSAQNL